MIGLGRRWLRWCSFSAGLLLAGIGACDIASVEDHVLRVESTGQVQGVVYFDENGSESPDESDDLLEGVGVWIVQASGGSAVATDVTDSEGVFVMTEVPVGTYRIAVDPDAFPDSLEVRNPDEDVFVLAADETVTRGVRATFPAFSIAEVEGLSPGVRLFTTGIALNPRVPTGDGSLHIQEGNSYLRAVNVGGATVSAGDSVRLRGRTALEAGEIVLDDVTSFILSQGARIPTPIGLGTSEASTAASGALDAALIRISGAEIADTVSVDDGLEVTIDDGSGTLRLLIRSFLPFDLEPIDPGFTRIIEATGLLVKDSEADGDEWRLMPRIQGDLLVEEFPPLSVADIWGAAAGQNVTAHGIVLNPSTQPVPGTIHIRDEGVHIRVRSVDGSSPLPGDSVRVRARTARNLGRTLLDAELVTILAESGASVPQPAEVTTGFAAEAGGPARPLDAGLVRVVSAEILEAETVEGNLVLTADDGSGAVEIVVTPTVELNVDLVPGDTLESATGLLTPHRGIDGILRWRILPRFASDVVPEVG